MRLDEDMDILRIGIGANTSSLPPRLPTNDHLAQHLFCVPNSLDIPSS